LTGSWVEVCLAALERCGWGAIEIGLDPDPGPSPALFARRGD